MSRRWGLSDTEWADAKIALRELLDEAARSRSTVTYAQSALTAFGGRFSARSGALMDLLGEVDREARESTGLMPASLVVRKDTGMPGEGYFRFVGEVSGMSPPDREEYWRREVLRVWDSG